MKKINALKIQLADKYLDWQELCRDVENIRRTGRTPSRSLKIAQLQAHVDLLKIQRELQQTQLSNED